MNTKTVSKAEAKRAEMKKERQPFYNDVSRFQLPKIPGYHVCMPEEKPGLMQRYIDAGYVFVKENSNEIFELDREQELKENPDVWRVIINPSYHAAGTPMGIVLAIKEEWYQEDMEEKARRERARLKQKDIKDDKI